MVLSSATCILVACSGTLVGLLVPSYQRDINIMLSGPSIAHVVAWLLSMISSFLNMLTYAYSLVIVVWFSFIHFSFLSLGSFFRFMPPF
jgi:hypothetical protein